MIKRATVEVIVKLFEIVFEYVYAASGSVADNQVTISRQLEESGFSKELIIGAFDWFKGLIEQQIWYASSSDNSRVSIGNTFRIFDKGEQLRLGIEVRNFLIDLEKMKILDTNMREIVIHQLIQLDNHLVSLEDAKWVVFLVLLSKFNANFDNVKNYLMRMLVFSS